MKPEPGFTTEAKIIRVIDGDTIEVEVRRTLKVRLLDCWSPDKTEKDSLAKRYIEEKSGEEEGKCILSIPAKNPLRLTDINTFDRILGYLWIGDECVNDKLVEMGLATREKE